VIKRHQPLIEALLGLEHRLDAEQQVEEAELGDMPAEHRDADRERRREQQPDRAPEPGPEDHCGDDRDRGESRALAVEPRLDDPGEQRFEREERTERPCHRRPAIGDGEGEDRRQRRRHPHACIGDEAQHHAEQAEEERVRDADEIQRDAERDAEERVHHQLHAEGTG